jgi:phosphonate transport system permease protein
VSGFLERVAVRNLAGLQERYPAAFASLTRGRVTAILVGTALLGAAALALWRLDFSFVRIVNGLGSLGQLVVLMLPPNPGSWAKAALFLHALLETIAIAL